MPVPRRRDRGVILVLPGGGYRRHAPHEAEPVAGWLSGLGWTTRVVRYPVLTRHPGPLAAVRREIAAERAHGAHAVGVPVGHSYLLGTALPAAGVGHELHVFPGDVHGIGLAVDTDAAAWTSLAAA